MGLDLGDPHPASIGSRLIKTRVDADFRRYARGPRNRRISYSIHLEQIHNNADPTPKVRMMVYKRRRGIISRVFSDGNNNTRG